MPDGGNGDRPVIWAEGLTKSFGDALALGGVAISVEHVTILAMLGPNGAGKTTTVRILTGLENLELVGRLYHLPRAEAKKRAEDVLERFDLASAAHRTVRTYSGGMRRRLDLGASLVGRPTVLFLDEPTTGLDPRGRL